MLNLPVLNVRLTARPEDWRQMTPTAQGRHCRSCDREVLDFTHATPADVRAARDASPDGRLCGRFRREQLAQPRLRPKLRRFLVALVLVCGLGLTSGEEWAQASQEIRATEPAPLAELKLKAVRELNPTALAANEEALLAPVGALPSGKIICYFGENMPTFKGGWEAQQAYIKQNIRYPKGATAAGKVFVSFTVTKAGVISDASITKGVDPLLDAEALRLVRQMPAWKPGEQRGKPVDVRYTVPVAFVRQ